MVPDPTPGLPDTGDSRVSGPDHPDRLDALIADLQAQHARYLTVLEEALTSSAELRREAAEEAARVLASARHEAERLRAEALADRERARDERVRLAAARAQAEEALAHTRHALSAITAPLPEVGHRAGTAHAQDDEPPREPKEPAAAAPQAPVASTAQAPGASALRKPVASATEPDASSPNAASPPAGSERPRERASIQDAPPLDTTPGGEPERHLIGKRVLLAAVVPPCLLLLGVFASLAWRGATASTQPLRGTHLPPLSYELVAPPVSHAALPQLSGFTLTAARPTWLRLTIDGRRGPGFVLIPGNSRVVPAERDLVIRTGDAGAISVSITGAPAAVMGPNGQVLSRHYFLPGSAPDPQPRTVATTGAPQALLATEPLRAVPHVTAVRRASAPPAVSPVPLPAAAAALPAPPVAAAPDSDQITTAARRWLTAYTRGDRRGVADLTAPGFELLDERPVSRRFTANQQAQRSLADAEVSVSGDGAVLSARMIERLADSDSTASDRTAYMSQVWIRQSGSWRLLGVRIRSADQVERMFKR